MKENIMNIVKKDKKKLFLLMALAFVAVFLLILGSSPETGSSKSKKESVDPVVSVEENNIETELSFLLSQIDGAGKVEVMIRRDGSGEDIYAYDEEITVSASGDGTTEQREHRELVLVDGDGAPVVISHREGEILGVLVVSEGAADDRVRASLIDAVASCLDIGKNRIEVTAMEVR